MSTAAMPWTRYQAQPTPSGDAKPWEKYAAPAPAQSTPVAPADTRNGLQRAFDNLTTVTPEQDASTPRFLKPIAHFGAGAIQGAGSPFVHPLDTLAGIGHTIAHPVDTAQSVWASAKEDPAKALGNLLGGAVLGEGAGIAGEAASPLVQPFAETLKDTGGKFIDRAAGSLQKDFRRGAQPGRAYLEGGGKPAFTMRSLADKANAVREDTGQKLGHAYAQSSQLIPASDVDAAVQKPIMELRNLQSGPGGTGVSPALNSYEQNMTPTIAKAFQEGGFTPKGLFEDMKRPIARSTNWKDPSMFDLNQVRQENVGGIGDLLTDAVPEAKPLNKIFQGTNNLANTAARRAETGSSPLSNVFGRVGKAAIGTAAGSAMGHPGLGLWAAALDTVPARTATGYGLFKAGQLLPRVPGALSVIPPAALGAAGSAGVSVANKRDKKERGNDEP